MFLTCTHVEDFAPCTHAQDFVPVALAMATSDRQVPDIGATQQAKLASAVWFSEPCVWKDKGYKKTRLVKLSVYYYAGITPAYAGITPADGAKVTLASWTHRVVHEDIFKYKERLVILLIVSQIPSTYWIYS